MHWTGVQLDVCCCCTVAAAQLLLLLLLLLLLFCHVECTQHFRMTMLAAHRRSAG
jgi:hypothetical protein